MPIAATEQRMTAIHCRKCSGVRVNSMVKNARMTIFSPSSEERRDASTSRSVWKKPYWPATNESTHNSISRAKFHVAGYRVNGIISGMVNAPNTPMINWENTTSVKDPRCLCIKTRENTYEPDCSNAEQSPPTTPINMISLYSFLNRTRTVCILSIYSPFLKQQILIFCTRYA